MSSNNVLSCTLKNMFMDILAFLTFYSQTGCSVPLNVATFQLILQCSLAHCSDQVATGTCKQPRKLQVSIFQVPIILSSYRKNPEGQQIS